MGSPFAQAVLVFRGGADGEESPIRVIQGPRTQMVTAGNGVDKVAIDPVNGEIFVPTRLDQVLVFDREANGNVAPKRVLGGPDTGNLGATIRVDAERDLLYVSGRGAVLVFDRTASGNTPPRAVIPGPSSNQFALYNDLIVTPRADGYLYAWSIHNTAADLPPGEDPKPVLKIPAPLGPRAHQLGIVLDPVHKEVIIGSGAGNQIRTFSVPEIFDWVSPESSQAD